jgi:hypothetical protein
MAPQTALKLNGKFRISLEIHPHANGHNVFEEYVVLVSGTTSDALSTYGGPTGSGRGPESGPFHIGDPREDHYHWEGRHTR